MRRIAIAVLLLTTSAFAQKPLGGGGGGASISGTGCIPGAASAGQIVVTGATTGTCDPSSVAASSVVVGPTSATDNHIAAYNLTTGKLVKDSGVDATNPLFNTLVGQPATSVTAIIGRVTSGGAEYGIEVQNKVGNTHIAGINGSGLFDGTMALSGVTGLASGIATFLATPTSANLLATMTTKTGTGNLVFATTPTLVTPILGVATATSINKVTITAPATGSTLTIPDGVTLTGPSASATVATLGLTNTLTGRQDATGAASTAPMKTGTSLPGTCVVGDLYFKSDATAGQNIYECDTTNTWTQQLNSGGSGGSAFTGSTAVTSAFSATPTFSLADVSVKSPTRFEPGALTANVTSVTFTNKTAGAKFSIAWLQDSPGGRTISYGASASNTCTISATASKTTTQQFEVAADGTTVIGTGCTSNDPLDTPLTALSTVQFATPGASHTFSQGSDIFVCTTTCTITVPVPAAGLQYCVMNDDNVSTVITLSAIGSSARYENTARTAYGTAGTGTFVSGGAVGDKICIIGRDSTHYLTAAFNGAWTAN